MMNWIAKKEIDSEQVNCLLSLCNDSGPVGQFTNYGPLSILLEATIREKLDIIPEKSVIVTNSGTSALHALKSGLDVYHKDHTKSNENLLHENNDSENRSLSTHDFATHVFATQDFTFPASCQGSMNNSTLVDINSGFESPGPDLKDLGQEVDGLVVTNVFGYLTDLQRYISWAEDNNKFLIFDNAACPYSYYKGTNSLNIGTGSIISFHHTKPIGFGECGAIIVDKKYEYTIRRLINFGFSKGNTEEESSTGLYAWSRLGSNYKASEISIAYTLSYFDSKFQSILQTHSYFYNFVKDYTRGKDYKLLPDCNDEDLPSLVACFPIIFPENRVPDIKSFLDAGVEAKKYYNPLSGLPNSQKLYERTICFPCNVDINIEKLMKTVNNVFNQCIPRF